MDTNGFFTLALDEPWTFRGLLSGIFVAVLFTTSLHLLHGNFIISLSVLAPLTVTWSSYWYRKNSIRKIDKNAIGLVLCIHISDKRMWKKVQEDFVHPLARELKCQTTHRLMDILILPPHITSKYTSMEEASTILLKTGARALIFGFVRERESRFTIDLTCSVRHAQLRQESMSTFQKDISTAWVRRFNLENQTHRIELFEISSTITSICAQYILALSLYASRDFENSEIIFASLKVRLPTTTGDEIPTLRTIRINTSKNLNYIYLQQAQHYLRLWHQTAELPNIEIMEKILAKVFGVYKRNGHYLTLVSISSIILRSDFQSAKSNLLKIKPGNRNFLWHLNIAFVNACEGNEAGVLNHYEIARTRFDTEVNEVIFELIVELEEFIERYRASVGDNPLYCFMLAYLNNYFKGDTIKAAEDRLAFLQHPKAVLYPKTSNVLKLFPSLEDSVPP